MRSRAVAIMPEARHRVINAWEDTIGGFFDVTGLPHRQMDQNDIVLISSPDGFPPHIPFDEGEFIAIPRLGCIVDPGRIPDITQSASLAHPAEGSRPRRSRSSTSWCPCPAER